MKNYKLVMEIISLAILVNENTELCTFVDFSGHVNTISARVFPSKSEEHTKNIHRIYSKDAHCNDELWMNEGESLTQLQEIKEVLKGYLFNIEESYK